VCHRPLAQAGMPALAAGPVMGRGAGAAARVTGYTAATHCAFWFEYPCDASGRLNPAATDGFQDGLPHVAAKQRVAAAGQDRRLRGQPSL
jgi:hypothetical protein